MPKIRGIFSNSFIMFKLIVSALIYSYCILWFRETIEAAIRIIDDVKFMKLVDEDEANFSHRIWLPENKLNVCKAFIEKSSDEELVNKSRVEPQLSSEYDPALVLDGLNKSSTDPVTPMIYGEEIRDVATVILTSRDKFPLNCIEYKLKWVTQISQASQSMADTQDSSETIDIERFSRGDRLRMCKDAFAIFPHDNKPYFFVQNDTDWSLDASVGEVKLYNLVDVKGKRRLSTVAFQCSIQPVTFVTLPELSDRDLTAWLLIQEKDDSSL